VAAALDVSAPDLGQQKAPASGTEVVTESALPARRQCERRVGRSAWWRWAAAVGVG